MLVDRFTLFKTSFREHRYNYSDLIRNSDEEKRQYNVVKQQNRNEPDTSREYVAKILRNNVALYK